MDIKTMSAEVATKKDKKMVMREKIMNLPTLELTGDNLIDDFKVGKKIKLEVEAELLSERRGLNKWELAEGEKAKNMQTVLIKKIKIIE